jgi:hypothetical protein
MQHQQSTCTNPELRRRLFIEVMHTGLNEGAVSVSPELLNHAETCEKCSSEFKQWVQKADIGGLLHKAREIVRLAQQGDPSIQSRAGQNKYFYFRPNLREETAGVVVTVDLEGNILAADEESLDDFLQLR